MPLTILPPPFFPRIKKFDTQRDALEKDFLNKSRMQIYHSTCIGRDLLHKIYYYTGYSMTLLNSV